MLKKKLDGKFFWEANTYSAKWLYFIFWENMDNGGQYLLNKIKIILTFPF